MTIPVRVLLLTFRNRRRIGLAGSPVANSMRYIILSSIRKPNSTGIPCLNHDVTEARKVNIATVRVAMPIIITITVIVLISINS